MSEAGDASKGAVVTTSGDENLTPEQKAKKEAKKKAKEEAKAAKLAKFEAKKRAAAAAASGGGGDVAPAAQSDAKAAAKAATDGGGGGSSNGSKSAPTSSKKSNAPIRLKKKFINTTPVGEKKDMSVPMAAAYDPPAVESAWYAWWERQGYFKPSLPTAPKFVICIPPPNVTGWLHLGHALTNSVQDTLVRWHRMRGFDTLWVPGMDHAGIATQRVVERVLWREQRLTRHDLGRDRFVERVWEWKEEYGGKIVSQLRRMGSSVDWDREVFTMDEKLSRAVEESFIRFYDEGLIYRANRLVNYCCELETAISDIEVDHVEVATPTRMKVPGHSDDKTYEFGLLWKFAYRLAPGQGDDVGADDEIVVATTRPETMLGDTAVAVHPDDDRYKRFIGKRLVHPFCSQEVRVVADSTLVKMEFGTGAVKVTPAHDPNDYECGKRHSLPLITIFTNNGRVAETGGQFAGLPRFDARYAVLEALKKANLYRGEEPSAMTIPVCSRTKDIIEPMLCPQWYLNCDDMAARAAAAVRAKELAIVPPFHEHTWFHYLDNIRDWCISRQLWWGHRVPIYRVSIDGKEVVVEEAAGAGDDAKRVAADAVASGRPRAWVAAKSMEEAQKKAAKAHGISDLSRVSVSQDEDVLDTWYSSGLFPFSVFGWPDETEDLSRFFPTSVLETGHDILFFWVARMVMMSLHLTNRLPFRRVLLHAMVRDAHNRKMSKSKGNVIDPVWVVEGITLPELHQTLLTGNLPEHEVKTATAGQKADFPKGIPECGTDALRFGLCAYTMQGRDINLDVNRVAAYRNFCNKLWQVVRFALSHLSSDDDDDDGGGGGSGEGENSRKKLPTFLPAASAAEAAKAAVTLEERWILSRLATTTTLVDDGLESFNLGEATGALHRWWLNDFCDVFIEAAKPYVYQEEWATTSDLIKAVASVRQTLYTCIDIGLRLLHPFMPYVTEELWQRLPRRPNDTTASIMLAAYPCARRDAWLKSLENEEAEQNMAYALQLLSAVRRSRAAFQLTRRQRPPLLVRITSDNRSSRLKPFITLLRQLADVAEVSLELTASMEEAAAAVAGATALRVADDCVAFLTLKGFVDVVALKSSLESKVEKFTGDRDALLKKMSVEGYDAAPADVRERNAARLAALDEELSLMQQTLESISQFN